MNVSIQRYGESGFLVTAPEFEQLDIRASLDAVLLKSPPQAYLERVWGTHNLLLVFQGCVSAVKLREWFANLVDLSSEVQLVSGLHEVPVVYDGVDLDTVATQVGISVEQVIALHTAPEYRVRMMGFSPGFPYLDGLDARLHLPRRASPRQRIEPGSVAIGGSHAGIYSVASPGGWHLLGRTELSLFNPERARGRVLDAGEVFAFQPGDRIRFVPVQVEVGQ